MRRQSSLDNRTYGPLTPAEIFRTFAHEHPWVVATPG
jgi:hypothetical protein